MKFDGGYGLRRMGNKATENYMWASVRFDCRYRYCLQCIVKMNTSKKNM